MVTTPSASLSEATNEIPTSNPEVPQPPANDLSNSSFVGGPSEEAGPSTIGVAEASNRYKAEKGTRNARTLSNEDVQAMLEHKSGVTMAKNMPPLGSGALEQGIQAQGTGLQSAAQSAQSIQQNAQTNASPNQQRQTASGQTGTPPPAPAGKSADTSASAENSTTPQINQNQQSNDAQGSRRLPATATFLPMLGLLGLVSVGIGFWFRKFRN
jgi:cobalamin biosynthesis Mg chelatase CobN